MARIEKTLEFKGLERLRIDPFDGLNLKDLNVKLGSLGIGGDVTVPAPDLQGVKNLIGPPMPSVENLVGMFVDREIQTTPSEIIIPQWISLGLIPLGSFHLFGAIVPFIDLIGLAIPFTFGMASSAPADGDMPFLTFWSGLNDEEKDYSGRMYKVVGLPLPKLEAKLKSSDKELVGFVIDLVPRLIDISNVWARGELLLRDVNARIFWHSVEWLRETANNEDLNILLRVEARAVLEKYGTEIERLETLLISAVQAQQESPGKKAIPELDITASEGVVDAYIKGQMWYDMDKGLAPTMAALNLIDPRNIKTEFPSCRGHTALPDREEPYIIVDYNLSSPFARRLHRELSALPGVVFTLTKLHFVDAEGMQPSGRHQAVYLLKETESKAYDPLVEAKRYAEFWQAVAKIVNEFFDAPILSQDRLVTEDHFLSETYHHTKTPGDYD